MVRTCVLVFILWLHREGGLWTSEDGKVWSCEDKVEKVTSGWEKVLSYCEKGEMCFSSTQPVGNHPSNQNQWVRIVSSWTLNFFPGLRYFCLWPCLAPHLYFPLLLTPKTFLGLLSLPVMLFLRGHVIEAWAFPSSIGIMVTAPAHFASFIMCLNCMYLAVQMTSCFIHPYNIL